jgi:outer membrane lipoprotein-sorting protein
VNQKILSHALPLAALTAAAALLGGCVELPTAPTVAAMPSAYKPLEVFQADDVACRGYASQQVAGQQGGSYSYDYPYNLQYRYNVAYEQCMYSKGNQLPGYTPPVSSIAPPR